MLCVGEKYYKGLANYPALAFGGLEAAGVKLAQQGNFTWKERAAELADELRGAASRDEPGDGSHYHHHWLAALERQIEIKRLADSPALATRKKRWAEVYRRTLHGKPVELP